MPRNASRVKIPLTDPYAIDPYAIMDAPQFKTSTLEAERDCLTSALMEPIDAYAETYGPFYAAEEAYTKAADLCRDEQGLLRVNPILQQMCQESAPTDKAFDDAMLALDRALSAEVIGCIAEALTLAGVTDGMTIAETCRCVLRGGTMWDGQGFTKDAPAAH